MIPKIIYQTWKTKELPASVEAVRTTLQIQNPEYTIILFDDSDMDEWIHTHMPQEVVYAYNSLAVGAAKADLWRYCILYTNGGIYLDIDSTLLVPIQTFLSENDQAAISRERNKGLFSQCCLAFEQGHPILKAAIDKSVKNIKNRSSTNIAALTGPLPFTEAVNEVMIPYYSHYTHLWYQPDSELNKQLNTTSPVRCKFMGMHFIVDSIEYLLFKHSAASDLYLQQEHWLHSKHIFKD